MTLYIIGNGFDLKHCLQTSYNNFHEYLQITKQTEMLELFDRYFNFNSTWSDFEEKLGHPDVSQWIDDERDLISDDDEPDSYTHTFGAKIYETGKILTDELKLKINGWILDINSKIPMCTKLNQFCMDKDDFYITFNYTDTLELLYNIPDENICHIHGQAKKINCKPGDIPDEPDIIIGHSFEGKIDFPKAPNNKSVFSFYEGTTEIEGYLHKSYKYAELIIKDHAYYFDKNFLKDFDEIFIIGHSLSKVDDFYFKKIVGNMASGTKIKITYFGSQNKKNIVGNAQRLGINNALFIDIK